MKERFETLISELNVLTAQLHRLGTLNHQIDDLYTKALKVINSISVLQIPEVKSGIYDHMIGEMYVQLYGINAYKIGSDHYHECVSQLNIRVTILNGLVDRNFK